MQMYLGHESLQPRLGLACIFSYILAAFLACLELAAHRIIATAVTRRRTRELGYNLPSLRSQLETCSSC